MPFKVQLLNVQPSPVCDFYQRLACVEGGGGLFAVHPQEELKIWR